jgi:stearoyl-CoA desaturase (delta-9 desaturase)
MGEAVGLWHMSSLDEWSIIHAFHHAHSDDPEKDPHPPAGLTFVQFVRVTAQTIGARFGRHFVAVHGPDSLKFLKKTGLTSLLRQILASTFWFLLLGPELYIFLFATNIVFKKLHYAWFNWATHVGTPSGSVEVRNLNHGLYRFINLIAFNLYYHGSHHLRPQAFKPRPAPETKAPAHAA